MHNYYYDCLKLFKVWWFKSVCKVEIVISFLLNSRGNYIDIGKICRYIFGLHSYQLSLLLLSCMMRIITYKAIYAVNFTIITYQPKHLLWQPIS